jgi:hypothetical protein
MSSIEECNLRFGAKVENGISWSHMTETEVSCPFCGETFTTLVDCSEEHQTYVEDCFVCCRPIVFHVTCNDGELVSVETARE